MIQLKLPLSLANRLATHPTALAWLKTKFGFGKRASSIEKYAYVLADYTQFCEENLIDYIRATQDNILAYLEDLKGYSTKHTADAKPRRKLSNSTRRDHLSAIRLYYNFLVEKRIRDSFPITHDMYSPRNRYGNPRRGLIPVERKSVWIPNDEQWKVILDCLRGESLRNNLMIALTYECALRKNEVCTLRVHDIIGDTITLPAERTKTNCEGKVKFSARTRKLLDLYLKTRPDVMGSSSEALFLSESTQNRGQPISGSTWRKVVDRVAARAGLPRFTPHTLRHLSITHFANQGWNDDAVARFGRHRSQSSSGHYRHPSPQQLIVKVAHVLTGIAASGKS